MPLYQLTLFYPNLKEHAATVRHVRDDIESIAGKNWRVLSAGEQVCAIVFETNVEHEQLRSRLSGYGSEFFLFLLVEISETLTGYLSKDIWQWITSRLPRKKYEP
ncbi:MAG: hypothetical protein Q8O79_02710 [Pseudomonadota bacterium]|nr:hypothetical protein [Pseudomonadota bacterium]